MIKKVFLPLIMLALMACGPSEGGDTTSGATKDEKKEVNLPENRSLSPYEEHKEPVTAGNLQSELEKWKSGFGDKEVSFIAWIGGGISGSGNMKKFSAEQNPGVIIFKAELSNEELQKIGEVVAGSQHIVLKGKPVMDGNDLVLKDAKVTSAYTDSVEANQQLTPENINVGNPVYPSDYINAFHAWNDKVVVITDKGSIPTKGNVITFPNQFKAKLAAMISDGSGKEEVVTVKGKVYAFQTREGEYKTGLKDAEIVED